jgi:hypothetical protein
MLCFATSTIAYVRRVPPSQRSRPTSLTRWLSTPQLKRTDDDDGKPWFDEASQTIDPVRDAHIDSFFRLLGGRLLDFSVAMHARARRRHRSSSSARAAAHARARRPCRSMQCT